MKYLRLIVLAWFMVGTGLVLAKTPSHIHIFSSSNIMGYVKPCG